MELFVLRHGEAQQRAASDRERQLTEQGEREVRKVVKRNLGELANITHIIASPYVRAQQTAAIARQLIEAAANKPVPLHTSDLLTPDSDPRKVEALLNTATDTAVLLVSHQPLVGTLVDWLADLEPGCYRMGTSSLACLQVDMFAQGCAELLALHHAEG